MLLSNSAAILHSAPSSQPSWLSLATATRAQAGALGILDTLQCSKSAVVVDDDAGNPQNRTLLGLLYSIQVNNLVPISDQLVVQLLGIVVALSGDLLSADFHLQSPCW